MEESLSKSDLYTTQDSCAAWMYYSSTSQALFSLGIIMLCLFCLTMMTPTLDGHRPLTAIGLHFLCFQRYAFTRERRPGQLPGGHMARRGVGRQPNAQMTLPYSPPSSSSLLTSSPLSIASCLLLAARSLFLSNSFCNRFPELNTPFVPAPHCAQLGSRRYRVNAHGSQK